MMGLVRAHTLRETACNLGYPFVPEKQWPLSLSPRADSYIDAVLISHEMQEVFDLSGISRINMIYSLNVFYFSKTYLCYAETFPVSNFYSSTLF